MLEMNVDHTIFQFKSHSPSIPDTKNKINKWNNNKQDLTDFKWNNNKKKKKCNLHNKNIQQKRCSISLIFEREKTKIKMNKNSNRNHTKWHLGNDWCFCYQRFWLAKFVNSWHSEQILVVII
jgi:hypothetical protein